MSGKMRRAVDSAMSPEMKRQPLPIMEKYVDQKTIEETLLYPRGRGLLKGKIIREMILKDMLTRVYGEHLDMISDEKDQARPD
jgi:hypothetical protein